MGKSGGLNSPEQEFKRLVRQISDRKPESQPRSELIGRQFLGNHASVSRGKVGFSDSHAQGSWTIYTDYSDGSDCDRR